MLSVISAATPGVSESLLPEVFVAAPTNPVYSFFGSAMFTTMGEVGELDFGRHFLRFAQRRDPHALEHAQGRPWRRHSSIG